MCHRHAFNSYLSEQKMAMGIDIVGIFVLGVGILPFTII